MEIKMVTGIVCVYIYELTCGSVSAPSFSKYAATQCAPSLVSVHFVLLCFDGLIVLHMY